MPDVRPITDPEAIAQAAALLDDGQLVVIPTDTVYGVAAHPARPTAITALYAAKQRPPQKAIPVLLSDIAHHPQVAQPMSAEACRFAAAFWPGPLTLVVEKSYTLSPLVSTLTTVGIRIPDQEGARQVIEAAGGALAVTSANRSGDPNPVTVKEASAQLGEAVALYLDGGPCPGGIPSTVAQLTGSTIKVLRPGPLSQDELAAIG